MPPMRPGKAPGAFSHPTVPSAHPYVLLNYQGRPRDVMILAHELGHGVHQVLAAPNGALMAPTPLTLAETASVFGEMLTFRSMLRRGARRPRERFALLATKVEDMLNTVVRQIAFYSFERKLHEERKAGELTAERIGELWLSVQARKPRPRDPARPGLRDLLGLRAALHPLALLRLRLCVRRLPRELALRRLREDARRASPSATSPCSSAGGSQQLQRSARAVRPRRPRSRILDDRARPDRRHDSTNSRADSIPQP